MRVLAKYRKCTLIHVYNISFFYHCARLASPIEPRHTQHPQVPKLPTLAIIRSAMAASSKTTIAPVAAAVEDIIRHGTLACPGGAAISSRREK